MRKKNHPMKSTEGIGAFGRMRLIRGEEWKHIEFVNKDAESSSVLIVAKTEPEPFRGFYVRRWDHPYEPNFETKTYNLLEFCQQDKVQNYFETGKAGNLIVWTRDEKNKKPYFIGAYEEIRRFRRIEGIKDGIWKPRTALVAAQAYVVPYSKATPMRDFESEFRRRNLLYPSEEKISPFHSVYGRNYVVEKELTEQIMQAIRKNAVESKDYLDLAELHIREMLMRRLKARGRKINADRFRERFVTKREIEYAKKMGIL